MNIFVDAGASDGGTIRRFLSLYPRAEEYEIHAFEPDFVWPEIPGVRFHRKAVWTEDGIGSLYRGRPESSTLIRGKTTGHIDYDHPVTVPTIDFGRWLCQFDPLSVVLKMDIEGAEYPVLQRMKQTGAFSAVREIHIDWHWNKIGMAKKVHDGYVQHLINWGIRLYDLSNAHPEFLGEYP